MKVAVYNRTGEKVKEVELPTTVFGASWKPLLVKQVLEAQLSNRRRPWAHAKDRSEVRGGGRKPWRQKGTGRARHGSTRSPIWVGGGKSHGPNKERDYSQKVNKKMRRVAIFSVLSRKLKEDELKFIEKMPIETAKTKELSQSLRAFLALKPQARKFDVLLIPSGPKTSLAQAAANLGKVKVLPATSLNIYDLLNHKHLLLDQEAVEVIAKHYTLSS